MRFDEILTGVLDLLQRQGRVSYRALKRRFDLDDDYLEDLKAKLITAPQLARDEAGEVLVWTGGAGQPQLYTQNTTTATHRGCWSGRGARGSPRHQRVTRNAHYWLYQAMAMTFWLPQVEAVLAQAEER